jgi:hypothetical protein
MADVAAAAPAAVESAEKPGERRKSILGGVSLCSLNVKLFARNKFFKALSFQS